MPHRSRTLHWHAAPQAGLRTSRTSRPQAGLLLTCSPALASVRRALEVDYRDGSTGVWDAAGIMSDLRVCRGRRLLRMLRCELAQELAGAGGAGSTGNTGGAGGAGGGRRGGAAHEVAVEVGDYCHGGDRWGY